MEAEERSRIQKCLPTLVTHTLCEAAFLEFFVENGVFHISDIDTIKSKHGEAEQASEFYKLIQTRTNSYPILLEGLKRTGQSHIAIILEKGLIVTPKLNERSRVRKLLYEKEHDVPIPHSNITFGVHEPVAIFTGRRKEIESLHKMVLRSRAPLRGPPTISSRMTLVCGVGGIGKTQLARQYIKEYVISDFDANCIWLQGETETSLRAGFRTLAKDKLGIKTDDVNGLEKDIKSVLSDVYKFLSDSKCLFVLDNVERSQWLRKYLPKSVNSCPQIIITSRKREWDKGIEDVELFELEEEDAFQMVKRGLALPENDSSQDEIILKLVRRVQCFPLALQQTISYILDRQLTEDYSVETYLKNFEMEKRAKLQPFSDDVNFELFNDYDDIGTSDSSVTTFVTCKMAMERIGGYLRSIGSSLSDVIRVPRENKK